MTDKSRTWKDELISGALALRYAVTEPLLLKMARRQHAGSFQAGPDQPLITVYTPTYNRGEILMERAIKTVLAQTYANFELVIVGDHCTDRTEALVNSVNDPRIRFYNIPRRGYRYPPTPENHWLAGPVVAANTALGMARGEWIARIDDDDTWTPDHLETLLRFARDGDFEFVSAQYVEERHGERRLDTGMPALDPYYTRKPAPGSGYNPRIGGTSTWLYRNYLKLFRYNIHCWRKSWNRVNDIDLSIRIFQAGARMGFVDKIVTYVLPRPGESTVGLDAYLANSDKTLSTYHFND